MPRFPFALINSTKNTVAKLSGSLSNGVDKSQLKIK